MARSLLGLTALLCLLSLRSPATADHGEPPVTGEVVAVEGLNGTWQVVSIEFMGQKVDLPRTEEQTLTFHNGKVTMNQGMRNETGSYKTNDRKPLKEIDLVTPNETMLGLYRLDGDTLKIAFSLNGPKGNRPTGFDAKENGVVVLKRKK